MRLVKHQLILLLFISAYFFTPLVHAVEVDPSVDSENQIGRSLRFNEFFEQELVKKEKKLAFNEYYEAYLVKRAETIQQKPELRHLIDISIGHDRNTSFNPERNGDFFHEQRTRAVLDKFFILHPLSDNQLIQLQPEGGIYWKDYFNEDQLDAIVWSAGISASEQGNKPVKTTMKYLFNRIRYPYNARITQSSHQGSMQLIWQQDKKTAHIGTALLEWKNYDERKTLDHSANFTDDAKKDFRLSLGYQLRHQLFPNLGLSFGSTWSKIDSNDVFLNYSDYESVNTNASAFVVLTENLNQVMYGGFEYREYDDRFFVFNSTKPQLDRVFYGGSITEYRLNEKLSLIFTYRYLSNTSNNPIQEYSGSTMQLGTRFIF